MTIPTLRTAFFAALAAAFVYFPAGAGAENSRWLPYEGHLNVHFAIDHNGLSMTQGQFGKVNGVMTMDEANPEAAEVSVSIEAASMTTGFDYRDNFVRNRFFDAIKHRFITFKSTKIEKTGDKTAKLTGDLTLLGVTKPVTLDVTFNKAGKRPSGEDHYGFTATGKIDRTEWGMNAFSSKSPPFITGEDVFLTIDAEWVRQKQ